MKSFDEWLKSSATADFEFDDYTALENVRQSYSVQPRTEFEQYVSGELMSSGTDKMEFNDYMQRQAVEEVAEKSVTSTLRYVAQKYGLRRLGYAIPYVGWALLVYDIYSFGHYLAED